MSGDPDADRRLFFLIYLLSFEVTGNHHMTLHSSSSSPTVLLRGSLIVLRRKCGKPGCQCAGKDGVRHESPALSCSIGGKSHIITLTNAEVPLIKAALDRYRHEQDLLEAACVKGIAWLRVRVNARRSVKS